MAFFEFAQIVWETTKLTNVLTDNKSVTRFFKTKAIPPALWNACDFVQHFNFETAHIAGSVNRAADFLLRLELKVMENICLKIRKDIQRTTIGVITSFSDVVDREKFFSAQAKNENEAEQETL